MSVQDEIQEERERQDKKWGEQNHAPLLWRAILGEESGEVDKAILEGSALKYREEMIQVAAVAVAAVESLDRGNLEFVSYTKLQAENAALKTTINAALKAYAVSGPEFCRRILYDEKDSWPNRAVLDAGKEKSFTLEKAGSGGYGVTMPNAILEVRSAKDDEKEKS